MHFLQENRQDLRVFARILQIIHHPIGGMFRHLLHSDPHSIIGVRLFVLDNVLISSRRCRIMCANSQCEKIFCRKRLTDGDRVLAFMHSVLVPT